MKRKKLNIRERIYLEDLKRAAKLSAEIKLRDTLLLSDFCRYLTYVACKGGGRD